MCLIPKPRPKFKIRDISGIVLHNFSQNTNSNRYSAYFYIEGMECYETVIGIITK